MAHSLIKPPGIIRESSGETSLANNKGLAGSKGRLTKIKRDLVGKMD